MSAPTASTPLYAIAVPRRSSIREKNRRILAGGSNPPSSTRPARRSAPPRSPFSSPQVTARASSSSNNDKARRQSHQQKHVYIQNSSALARREQEMLRKGESQAQEEGQTASTRSMTTATIGSHSTLNATFDDHDDELAHSFECISGTTADKLSPQHSPNVTAHLLYDDESNNTSSDDESADYEEEESMDDEREWRRDNVLLLEMLQEASEDEETEVYEGNSRRSSSPSTASSSSGYISVDRETNSDDDDIIVDVDDDSFLNPPSMYSPHSLVLKNDSDVDISKEIIVTKSVTSRQSINARNRPHRHHRPPVAVVFEIDDYTSDSGALGEESLIDFVRDFTEEMKDESTSGSATRLGVRVYSTLGARRCDIKTMKQRVLSSETILSTILENRAKQKNGSLTMPSHEEPEIHMEDNAASLPSNDSTVEERPYHRRQFSKEMSTEEIVSSMRGEDILLKTPSSQTKKASSTTNASAPEQRFTTTFNEETDRRRRRLQQLRARRQADEQGSQRTSAPSISSATSVHSNRSGQQQQTSLRPIMHNKPPLRRDESIATENTGTSTPTVPTANLTHRQGVRSHGAKSTSSPPVSRSRPATIPTKKEKGIGRFFSRFSRNKAPNKEPPRPRPRPMTAGAAYRAAVAARSKPTSAPTHSVSITGTGPGPYHHLPPPAPMVQRYGGQQPLASSMQPRRLFYDDSTCTSVWGRCFDDEAASTAKAAAAWV